MMKHKKNATEEASQEQDLTNYHDVESLRRFISPEGKILPSRRTGLSMKNQRKVTKAIKRARMLSLLPFKGNEF